MEQKQPATTVKPVTTDKSNVPAGPAIPEAANITTAAKPAAILLVTVTVALIIALLVGIMLYAR